MIARRIYIGIFFTLSFFVISHQPVAAQVTPFVSVAVQAVDASGAPLNGLYVSLYNLSTGVYSGTMSNDYAMLSVPEGTYTLELNPQFSLDCETCSIYQAQSISVTVSAAQATTTINSQLVQLLGPYTMEVAGRYVTINVTDQNGQPAAELMISGNTSEGDWGSCTTGTNGQCTIAIADDAPEVWNFYAYSSDNSYVSATANGVSVAAEGGTSVDVSVIAADATISLQLVDADGAAFALPASGFGSVYCHDPSNAETYFYEMIDPGASSVDVSVVAGSYTCEASLMGYGARPANVTVATQQTVTSELVILVYDSTINFRYTDANGNILTEIAQFSLFATSTTDDEGNSYYVGSAMGTGANGEGSIQVLDGYTYLVGAAIIDSGDTQYMQQMQMTEVVGNAIEPQTVMVVLEEADATLKVRVKDPQGDAPTSGWVQALEASSTTQGWGINNGGATNENGVATLQVASGKTYSLHAYVYTEGNTTLPPGDIVVTPGSDETIEIDMQMIEPDFTLHLTSAFADDAEFGTAEANYAYCHAYSPTSGIETYASLENGSGDLSILSGVDWNIGCMATSGSTLYRSKDRAYTPPAGAEEDTFSINMQGIGSYYEPTSYTAEGSSATTFTLPDGESTLTVPANAITTSGTYTIQVQTALGCAVSEDVNPMTVFDFTAYDSSGNVVEEFSENLTLNLAYDPDLLEDFNIAEKDLVLSAYDEDTGAWESPVSTEVDAQANILTSSINHFSSYGAVGATAAADEPGKARRLSVTDIQATTAVLKWKKPKSDDATSYVVQLRKKGQTKEKKWKKYSDIEEVQKKVKKLKANTSYQFRVKACNSNGCSGYSEWKGFITIE